MLLFFYLYVNIVENAQWNLNIAAIPTFDYLKAISLFVVFLGGAAYLLFSIIGLNMVLYKRSDPVFSIKGIDAFRFPGDRSFVLCGFHLADFFSGTLAVVNSDS